jgi:hypothetical protein
VAAKLTGTSAMALIGAFIFSACTLAAASEPGAKVPAPTHGNAGSRCAEVAPLDDRYPLVVLAGSLTRVRLDLERLQTSRAKEQQRCIRFALGVHAAPQTLLASLRDIALTQPELLRGIAVIPLSSAARAPVLLWHIGHELRFQTLGAAAATANVYLP